jgi:hypothetical protein
MLRQSGGAVLAVSVRKDFHAGHQQDSVGTNLPALFAAGGDLMRWRRCNNARYGGDPACSSSQNLAKSSQLPGIAKGCCDVQQLQTFHGSELVPDR